MVERKLSSKMQTDLVKKLARVSSESSVTQTLNATLSFASFGKSKSETIVVILKKESKKIKNKNASVF